MRRPIPARCPPTRAILIEALRDAHRWLDELLFDPRPSLESIASRESKSKRSTRMTLSLAFLAPEIVKAAVEGRLPRGFGRKRLVDLPMAWPDQWRALGLKAPAQAQGTICSCSFAFTRGADPSIRNRAKCRGSNPHGPFEIGHGGHVANSNLGNRNLRPETFSKRRQEFPLRIAGPLTETGHWRGKLRKCRAILRLRKMTSIRSDFLVADAVLPNRSPSRGFPANRENNRESAREGEVEGA
jgi:hypothetical protein